MTRTNDTARERQLERYLLGTLAADDQDRLEEAFLADHDLFGELDAAEGILIDRYLEGDLPSEERQIFEERLLPSERVRDRVAMAGALQRLADERARRTDGEAGAGVVPISPFQNQRPVPGRSTTSWLAWAACLVLMLATGYLATLNIRLQNQFSEVHARYEAVLKRAAEAEEEAKTNAEALSEAVSRVGDTEAVSSHFRDELAFRNEQIDKLKVEIAQMQTGQATTAVDPVVVFLAIATRSMAPMPVVERPTKAPIKLQLDLDRFEPEGDLEAVVKRDGIEVWRRQDLEPVFAGPEAMTPLVLPNEMLLEGLYTIELTERTGDTTTPLNEYQFAIKN